MYLIQQMLLIVENVIRGGELMDRDTLGSAGPSLQGHLGGGAGGIKPFMDHLMDPLTAIIRLSAR